MSDAIKVPSPVADNQYFPLVVLSTVLGTSRSNCRVVRRLRQGRQSCNLHFDSSPYRGIEKPQRSGKHSVSTDRQRNSAQQSRLWMRARAARRTHRPGAATIVRQSEQ